MKGRLSGHKVGAGIAPSPLQQYQQLKKKLRHCLGYEPWTNIISTDRRNYLIAIEDYLGEKVSAYVESRLQSVVMPRMKDDRVYSVSVINCEIYGSEKTVIKIRNPYTEKPVYIDKDTSCIPSFTVDGNEMTVEVNNIEGWSVGTVYFEHSHLKL